MAQRLSQATYERVQDHLSSEGIFLMGDVQTQGFPIRYASPGFESVYGFTGQDIVGRKCGDLIGGNRILNDQEILFQAASAAECSVENAEQCVRFLIEKGGEACRVMMSCPNDRVGVSLVLNRKKSGMLFVCECLVLCLQHPSLNWSYTVGFQRDITNEVSVSKLFRSCAPGEYNRLLQSRASALEERRATLLGVGGENVVQYLHEKALSIFSLDVWRTLRSELLTSASTHGDKAAEVDFGPTAAPAPPAAAPAPVEPPVIQEVPAPGAIAPLQARAPVQPAPAAAAAPLVGQQPGQLSLQPAAERLLAQAQPGQVAYTGAPLNGNHHRSRLDQSLDQMKQSNAAVAFLAEVGLQQWAENLVINGYDDLESLMEMSEEDMRAVGMTRGHASKLKRRLRSLKCLQICDAGNPNTDGAPTLLQNLHGM